MRRLLLSLIIASLPARAADSWLQLKTPDFELYTSAGEKSGKEMILHFERVRAFFLKASPLKKPSDFPVRIVAFGSDKDMEQYRNSHSGLAWFLETPARDYIVTGEAASENFSIATHEYMHLMVQHSGLKLPVWLNEGWAEVYSTLRPMGKETAIGDILQGRVNDLLHHEWLDFETLTSVTRDSPNYQESSRAGVFYAESWALTHMLYFAPEYEASFGKFVMALNQGHTAADACQIAFGRTSGQVFADLHGYLDRKRIYGRAFAVPLARAQTEPSVSAVPDFDAHLMLADLLASGGKRDEARLAYAGLEKQSPGNRDLAMSLGYLAWQNHDLPAVLKHFGSAFDAGESDPRMCYHLAVFMREAKMPSAKTIAVLQRALQSKPDYPLARVQLGFAQSEARDFPGAISTLMALPGIGPESAAAVYCTLTRAYTMTGELTEARNYLTSCRKWSKTPPQAARADSLGVLLGARTAPEANVHPGEKLQQVNGTLRSMDCDSTPRRLQIQVGAQLLKFDLPSPAAIEMRPLRTPGFNLVCGTMAAVPVTVEYAPPRSAMEVSAGIVRSLTF